MENHTLTVKSAEILNVPVTASCYAIKAAYRNALALADKSVPLISLAYDWLAVRSELQRKVDLEKYEAANYHTMAEVIEMHDLQIALREAQRKTNSFSAYYSIFSGCRVTHHTEDGHVLETTAPGRYSGFLTTGAAC
jgi:hypothetical protein